MKAAPQFPPLTRKQVKYLRSLAAKKQRYAQRQFVVEGQTIVSEVLAKSPSRLCYLISNSDYSQKIDAATAAKLQGRVFECDDATLKTISALDTPSPVLALLDMPASQAELLPVKGLSLFLDGIRDPGNLGTILRVADWYGIATVYLAGDCVDVYNSKTLQASMGAFMRVRTESTSLAELVIANPDLMILGTSVTGGSHAHATAWPRDTLLVIGSESHGIRDESRELIAGWVSIPRGGNASGAESLNAAVATGILCAAFFDYQRRNS